MCAPLSLPLLFIDILVQAVGVSSVTGAGIKEFFDAVDASRTEYEKYVLCSNVLHFATDPLSRRDYLPELERAREAREKSLQDHKDDSMNRLMKDLAVDREANPAAFARDQWDEDDNEDEDGGDIDIIDRSEFVSLKDVLRF